MDTIHSQTLQLKSSLNTDISEVKLVVYEDSSSASNPLTLEDIRNTGFVGAELNKCGVETCSFECEKNEDLKNHLQQCFKSEENLLLRCKLCGVASKNFAKPTAYLEHLKVHGLKRFSCSLCKVRFSLNSQIITHIRVRHKCSNSRLIPADPNNPDPEGLFMVEPLVRNKFFQ